MKLKNITRFAALLTAAALSLSLAGCQKDDSSSEATEQTASPETATEETAVDPYAYLGEFDYSSIFDENGYLSGVTASDYVTIPADFAPTLTDEDNTVTAEQVSEYLNETVMPSFAQNVQITDRAAADGDTVNIDYSGAMDGEVFDGGTAEGYDLTLGSGRFIDGFEEQIVGHTPGETFDLTVTFPEDYNPTDLAGKDAVFTVTLNYISETQIPELTDDFVKENMSEALGIEDVATLNSYINDMLLLSQQTSALRSELSEEIALNGEAPEQLIQYFEDYYLTTPYLYAQMYGLSLDEFMAANGYTDAATYLAGSESYIQDAALQVLSIQALAEQYGIVCDTEALNSEFESYFGTDDSAGYIETYGENYLKMSVLDHLVMQQLIEEANA